MDKKYIVHHKLMNAMANHAKMTGEDVTDLVENLKHPTNYDNFHDDVQQLQEMVGHRPLGDVHAIMEFDHSDGPGSDAVSGEPQYAALFTTTGQILLSINWGCEPSACILGSTISPDMQRMEKNMNPDSTRMQRFAELMEQFVVSGNGMRHLELVDLQAEFHVAYVDHLAMDEEIVIMQERLQYISTLANEIWISTDATPDDSVCVKLEPIGEAE